MNDVMSSVGGFKETPLLATKFQPRVGLQTMVFTAGNK